MKYIVQVYTESGFQELVFDDEPALFNYVRKMDYVNHIGVKGNHVLDATMTNPNDSLRHKKLYDGSRRRDRRQFETGQINRKLRDRGDKYHRMLRDKFADMYYCVGYLIRNEYGRTIDLRNNERELYSFDYVGYNSLLRKKSHEESLKRWAKWDEEYEKECILLGSDKTRGYRNIQTTQERRYACDIEHKPFIRGRRRHLPDAWCAERPICKEKTWKARTKAKQQWQVNIQIHMDTVWYVKCVYEEELFPEYDGCLVLRSDDM